MRELITEGFREELQNFFEEIKPHYVLSADVFENTQREKVIVAYQPKHSTAYDIVELQSITRFLAERLETKHEQGMIRLENGWISLANENSTRNRFSEVNVDGQYVKLPEMQGQIGTKSNERVGLSVIVSPCQLRSDEDCRLKKSTYESIMKDRLINEAEEIIRQAAYNPLRIQHELPEVQHSDLEAYIERNQR